MLQKSRNETFGYLPIVKVQLLYKNTTEMAIQL